MEGEDKSVTGCFQLTSEIFQNARWRLKENCTRYAALQDRPGDAAGGEITFVTVRYSETSVNYC